MQRPASQPDTVPVSRRAMASRGPVRVLAVLLGAAIAAAVVLGIGPAQAAAKRVAAQLALSGVATADSPAGGSQIGIHPGDSVAFSAAGVPTVGLAKLGLGDLVPTINSLLSGTTSFRVLADFSGLPGGHAKTVLKGKRTARFSFRTAGTYRFTWEVQKVSVLSGLLGSTTKITTINLNGNELRKAGVKLNSHNKYVGSVVVRKNPPPGGISVQLPSIGAHPSVTGVGKLPKVGVPGVRLPTVHVTVPNLSAPALPGLPGSGKSSGSGGNGGSGGSGSGSGGSKNFTGPALTVPQLVVPTGNNAVVIPGSDNAGALPAYSGSSGYAAPGGSGASAQHTAVPAQPRARDVANPAPVTLADHAAQPADPSGQLPVLLAIIAIVTLALVAGTYARLVLLRRSS